MVALVADGVKTNKRVELTKNNSWKATFEDLLVYNTEGNKIVYSLEETTINGYTTKIDGKTITNTYTGKTPDGKTTQVDVVKKWDVNSKG